MAVHGRLSNQVGSLGAYDYFVLGGPFNCRGYVLGEIGCTRRYAEASIEIRCPIPRGRFTVYSFYEYIDSLNISREIIRMSPGNRYIDFHGAGISWGNGIQLGCVKLEYARNCSRFSGQYFIRYCERF